MKGIYVHIPFCLKKCPYCSFYSVSGADGKTDDYMQSVIKEIKESERISADTIYFGGGTPSRLGADSLCKILDALVKSHDIGKDAEITCEINPATIDANGMRTLYANGFNRISIGVQSLSDEELKILGRAHTAFDAVTAVENAYKSGFENISADIMFGLFGQNIGYTLSEFLKMPLKHISAYSLSIEEGTAFYNNPPETESEDGEREMYAQICEKLEQNGFIRYEISNFAKEGYESRHNLKYWQGEEYLGIGAGAHSYLNGVRYSHVNDIDAYIGGDFKKYDKTVIDRGERRKEYYMLGLRMRNGVKEIYHKNIEKLISEGLIERHGGNIRLTKRGTDIASYVMAELM